MPAVEKQGSHPHKNIYPLEKWSVWSASATAFGKVREQSGSRDERQLIGLFASDT